MNKNFILTILFFNTTIGILIHVKHENILYTFFYFLITSIIFYKLTHIFKNNKETINSENTNCKSDKELLCELKKIRKIKDKKLRELRKLQLELEGSVSEIKIKIENKVDSVPKCPYCGKPLFKRAGYWTCINQKCDFKQKIEESF